MKESDLRARAEEKLSKEKMPDLESHKKMQSEDVELMIHDLRVHKIELEMQNEELERVQTELDEVRSKYFDLYDSAPVGYLIISEKGLVLETNLTAANMLGVTRQYILKKRFQQFIYSEDQNKYNMCINVLFASKGTRECEVRLIKSDGTLMWGHIVATVSIENEQVSCRMVISDISAHKEVELALLESQTILQAAFDNSQAGIAIADSPDGKLKYVNKAGLLIGGGSEEELTKNIDIDTYVSSWNVLDLDGTPYMTDELPLTRAILNGETLSKEFIIKRENIQDRYILANAAPIKDANNNIKGGIVIFLDVTENKKIEEQLKLNMKDLLESQRIAHLGTWRLDLATNQVEWSLELYKMYGFDPSIPPPPYTEHMKLFTQESWNRLSTSLEKTRKFGIPYELELETVTKDGSKGWMWVRGEATKDSRGNIISLWGVAQDITERKKAECLLKTERDRANMYLETAGVMFLALNTEGSIILINKTGCDILGFLQEDILGKNWFDNFIPESVVNDTKQVFESIVRGDSEGEKYYENSVINASGEERLIFWHNTVLRDNKGDIIGTFSSGTDITEQKRAEKALKESERKFRTYTEKAPLGIFVSDEKGYIVDVNQAACELAGYSKEEILGMSVQEFLAPESLHQGLEMFEKSKSGGFTQGDFIVRRKKGGKYWINLSSVKIENNRIIAFFKDISEIKKAEKNLMYFSYHDQLTGLYNRRFFEEELTRLDREENYPISIIMCDVNGLKLINDSFGHAAGDEVLLKTAKAINICCRPEDIVSRLGGDEFVVLLPKTDTEDAIIIIDNIKELILKEKVFEININISFGVDTKKNTDQSIIEILQNSENYMYRHKLYEHNSSRSRTIDMIMNTLFVKSNRESLHSKRVHDYCEKIAIEMNFEKNEINKIKIAGLVHDIGKIGVSEAILNKPGKLNEEEWKEMKKHSESSWRILSSSLEYSEIARYIYEHHEKLDGSGYPRGLKGDEISIEARIIGIADAYDAMTSVRTYREALSQVQAIIEIKRCSGTQFDPKIAKIFVEKVLGGEW